MLKVFQRSGLPLMPLGRPGTLPSQGGLELSSPNGLASESLQEEETDPEKSAEAYLQRHLPLNEKVLGILSQKKRIAEAIEALKICDGCAGAHQFLGEIAEERGQLSKALAWFQQGIKKQETMHPNFKKPDATVAWRRIENRPYLRLLLAKRDLLHKMGKVDEAIAVANRLIEINPDGAAGI